MRTPKSLLLSALAFLAFATVCVHAQTAIELRQMRDGKKIIDADSFNCEDTVVVGRMGVPLGKVVQIEAIVVSGDSTRMKAHAGKYLLKVLSVGTDVHLANMPVYEFSGGGEKLAPDSFSLYKMKKGKSTGTLTGDEVRELEKDYVGRGFTLLVYESGKFWGMPQGMPRDPNEDPDVINGPSMPGFGFPYLQVVRVLKEWTVSEERAKWIQEQEKENAEFERVTRMMDSADIVVDYEWPDRIRFRPRNGKKYSDHITHAQMGTTIAGATDKREMAVVIMSPPMRMHSDEIFRMKVDEIERIIKAQGFKRVVFLLASAFGMPVYRE